MNDVALYCGCTLYICNLLCYSVVCVHSSLYKVVQLYTERMHVSDVSASVLTD